MARLLVFALLLWFTVFLRAPAAEADAIRWKTFTVSPYAFGASTDGFPKTPEGLVDLRAFLKIRNVEIPADGEATYDPKSHRVVVRAAEDVVERIAALWSDDGPSAVRAVFTLVEYNVGDSTDLPDMVYAELRKLAGNSWRVLDRVTLISRSGQRSTSEMVGKNGQSSKAAGAAKPKETNIDGLVAGTHFGTAVEMEPQIGPDGITIDLSFVYAYRSRAVGDQPSMLMRAQTNLTLTHNEPLIVQTATLAPPKTAAEHAPKRELAVIVTGVVLDRYGRSFSLEPDVKERDPRGADVIGPMPMRTEVFKIPPGYLGPAAPAPQQVTRRVEAMDYLKAAGIEFPPGSEATLDTASSRLSVHSTEEAIEKVRELVEGAEVLSPLLLRTVFTVAEFSIADSNALKDLTYEQARALAGDSWRLLDRASLLAKSGQLVEGWIPKLDVKSRAPSRDVKPVPDVPDEEGPDLEIESMIEKNGTDLAVAFHYRRDLPAARQGPST